MAGTSHRYKFNTAQFGLVNNKKVWCLPAGQFFCSGVCQHVSCATAAQVNQVYPPVLAYSTAATDLLGSKLVLYVQYGSPLPLNLQPCSSLSKPTCPFHSWANPSFPPPPPPPRLCSKAVCVSL